ncbi:MoxR family ATPase [Synechocystis salina LEGE 06155]|nr:MoxR family ATPase [Synechocystis salina LEGE 06155]
MTRPLFNELRRHLETVLVGQSHLIQELLVALLAGGHVIIEGVPGTGKTMLVKLLAQSIQSQFRRVQLTPDMLPSDMVGVNVFDFNRQSFSLKQGPVFTEILLADEINRTPPKTQSALLEAMEEQQVTLDGQTHALPALFWVVATQNPLEFEGTYPLPEAQLDRFLFKLVVDYPSQAAAKQMLVNFQQGFHGQRQDLEQLTTIATVEEILASRRSVDDITVDGKLLDYLLALVEKTRHHPDVLIGASPRACLRWLQAAKADAWLNGQEYLLPDNLKTVALPLLRHRLILRPEAQLDGISVDDVITAIVEQTAVPR